MQNQSPENGVTLNVRDGTIAEFQDPQNKCVEDVTSQYLEIVKLIVNEVLGSTASVSVQLDMLTDHSTLKPTFTIFPSTDGKAKNSTLNSFTAPTPIEGHIYLQWDTLPNAKRLILPFSEGGAGEGHDGAVDHPL